MQFAAHTITEVIYKLYKKLYKFCFSDSKKTKVEEFSKLKYNVYLVPRYYKECQITVNDFKKGRNKP